VSADEQHQATLRAKFNRASAEQLLAGASNDDEPGLTLDMAIVHLLLAIEDRLNYGSESILSGTISCQVCRAIVLEPNAEGHAAWHKAQR
jgi:hypothetical protein